MRGSLRRTSNQASYRREAPLAPLRDLSRYGRPRGRAAPFAQQLRNPHQLRTRLRVELLAQPGLEAREHLECVGAIPHPRACLDQPAYRVLREGIEIEQHLRVALHRREVTDSAPAVHLPHEAIADPRHQLRPPLVLPLLELHGSRYLEAVEELTTDLRLRGIDLAHVHLNGAGGERDGGALHDELVAPDLFLQYRQRLGKRVAGPRRRNVGPQQIHQIVAGELPPRFDGESDQQGEMLAGAETHLLACLAEEQGSTQREELQVRHHADASRRFGMVPLDTQINRVSTHCV